MTEPTARTEQRCSESPHRAIGKRQLCAKVLANDIMDRVIRRAIAVTAGLFVAVVVGCSPSEDASHPDRDGGAGPGGSNDVDPRTGDGSVDDPSQSAPDGREAGAPDGSTPVTNEAPTASALLAKLSSCTDTVAKGGFGLDGAGSISIMTCGSILHWKADMDVDCDGIQTPPCNTDPQGQPQTSIVDVAPHDVDPTLLPYFVIPLGKPETTWYTAHGVALGQLGAVIYKGQVEYGIFADEAGGNFIGESSYAMCQLFLGKPSGKNDPCDPSTGGIDPADVTYITFTGEANVVTGQQIFDHGKHTELGIVAAKAWLATQ
jgi:hypothetical protein